jgi:hypothetical protein
LYPEPLLRVLSSLFSRPWLRHSRRSSCLVMVHVPCASTFLHPLAPRALPRFLATMDALTPTRRLFGSLDHEHRSVPGGSPCLSRTHFQPFRPQPPRRLSHVICSGPLFLSVRGRAPSNLTILGWSEAPRLLGSRSGLRSALAGSPVGLAESGSACLMSLHRLLTDGLLTSGSSPPRVATTQ